VVQLVPVQYHIRKYPEGIIPTIREVAAHFDKQSIDASGQYSLHTEYSYTARDLDSQLIGNLSAIRGAQRRGIPTLWASDEWAVEFARFIEVLVGDGSAPRIIEIHPPFRFSIPTIKGFLERFQIFDDIISQRYPTTEILIENRFGTQCARGTFLISRISDLLELCALLDSSNLNLKVALDVPQLISAMGGALTLNQARIEEIFNSLKLYRHYIIGIHIWGKRRTAGGNRAAHIGNLDTYFEGVNELKLALLSALHNLFEDGIKRYFVPEVNSTNSDLASIIQDMEAAGFQFSGTF